MSDVAALIADMVRQGIDPDIIGRTAEALSQVNNVDRQAERRRARDRARKQEARLRNSAESADANKEKNQKKKTTPLGYTPKGDISSSPQGGTKKRATRIPADWQPDRGYAAEKGLSPGQIDTQAEKFRNYWQAASGQRATKADWPATWRNWVLTAVERQPRGQSPPNSNRPDTKTMTDAARSAYERYKAKEDAEQQRYQHSRADNANGLTIEGNAR